MPRGTKIMLSLADWPSQDRERWERAFKPGDRFEESSPGAHLASATRRARQESYGRYLGFIADLHPKNLNLAPERRISPGLLAEYVEWRKRSPEHSALANDISLLRDALKLLSPNRDWSWLLNVAKRIAASSPPRHRKYHLVTSERLYLLGIELMDAAAERAERLGRINKHHAVEYRDGLLIALLALVPLRSRTLTALRLNQQLTRVGDLWVLDIPGADTKTRRALDFPVSPEISKRIDIFVEQFRCRIPGANKHTGIWPSNKGTPMTSNGIYEAVRKRTKKAFGFGVNLHRFRHAAASFWSIQDPANVRGVKDLLGHASFKVTEKHYIMVQSRIAGRALAQALEAIRK